MNIQTMRHISNFKARLFVETDGCYLETRAMKEAVNLVKNGIKEIPTDDIYTLKIRNHDTFERKTSDEKFAIHETGRRLEVQRIDLKRGIISSPVYGDIFDVRRKRELSGFRVPDRCTPIDRDVVLTSAQEFLSNIKNGFHMQIANFKEEK